MIIPRAFAVLALYVILLTSPALAWDANVIPEPAQRTDAPFRLFRTSNVYTFLKLDTRIGQVWQVQWNGEPRERSVFPINVTPLTDGGKPGRFTLYPSSNIFTFILLDQEDGRQWQVQWGTQSSQRFVEEITRQFVGADNPTTESVQRLELPSLPTQR